MSPPTSHNASNVPHCHQRQVFPTGRPDARREGELHGGSRGMREVFLSFFFLFFFLFVSVSVEVIVVGCFGNEHVEEDDD